MQPASSPSDGPAVRQLFFCRLRWLRRGGLNPRGRVLSSSIYRYFGVPSRHFVALTGGHVSVGQYLNTEIKPRYRYERVA